MRANMWQVLKSFHIDAAHKFLMPLLIHPTHRLQSNDFFFLKVMRSLNWLRTIELQKNVLSKLSFKSRTFAIMFARVFAVSFFLRKCKKLYFFGEAAKWWNQLRNVFTSAQVVEPRVDDTTIVFIGRAFHTNIFFLLRKRRKKNSPKWSWHHMFFVCLLSQFICHQRIGLMCLCLNEIKNYSLISVRRYQFIDFSPHLSVFSLSISSNADSVDNPL